MQTEEIFSRKGKFLIFMYSPGCAVSKGVAQAINKYKTSEKSLEVIDVNVIEDEEKKDKINNHYQIDHKSPQIILIENQACKKILLPFEISPYSLKAI